MTAIIDKNDPVERRLASMFEDVVELGRIVSEDGGDRALRDHLLVAGSRLRTGLEQRQRENQRRLTGVLVY